MTATFIETRSIPLEQLTPYPGNARRGNIEAIRGSLRANGQYRSLIVRVTPDALIVLAGNHTLLALAAEGHVEARCETIRCNEPTARRINLADNRTAELGGYDDEALAQLIGALDGDFSGTGWTEDDYSTIAAADTEPGLGLADEDQPIPDPPTDPVSRLGDLWTLGDHRLLCGDSTNPADVRRVVGDATLTLIHADPPYGMGKEADGVLNDNLHGPRLDAFQLKWWNAWLPALVPNASVYIWGNAPDLWRLWWIGGLSSDPDLLLRNEIVWDKGSAIGMRSEGAHSYPIATERCLFLMRGQQFLGSQNKDDYWEGYEPLRTWLCGERDSLGWTNATVNTLTNTQMAGHWFSQSQFTPIPHKHYVTLQASAAGRAFLPAYDDLFDELFPGIKSDGNLRRRELSAGLRESRTFFDNTHDIMTDVWPFPRVLGEERHGHATPKPVAMVERALKSSSEPGDVIGVPFGGSGPEFIAATKLGRLCAGTELEPRYVDVICKRFEQYTGITPKRERENGATQSVSFLS